MKSSDPFVKLSSLITGDPSPNPVDAEYYRNFLIGKFGPTFLDEVLATYELAKKDASPSDYLNKAIAADNSRRLLAVAKQIGKLWYFSQYNDPDQGGKLANAGLHARSIGWRFLRAHPPSMSTSPFGYWSAKPK